MKKSTTQLCILVFIITWFFGLQNLWSQSWVPQNSNEGHPINAIAAVNENVVWAAGWEGSVLRTTDGGVNWVSGTVPGTQSFDFFSIAAINTDTAFYSGAAYNTSDARIYRTTDGGLNWDLQYSNTQPDAYFNAIAFWDESHGIAVSDAVGGSFLIVTTSDGGANWTPVPAANIPAPLPGEFAGIAYPGGTGLAIDGDSTVWFGTAYGTTLNKPIRVFKSTDQGQHWTVASTPIPTNIEYRGITTMAFQDALNGFAGATGGLIQTIDGGQTWSMVSSFLYPDVTAIEYVPGTNHKVIITASPGGTAYSTDSGLNWTSLSADDYLGLSFINSTTGWAAAGWEASKGLISKFQGSLLTAVKEDQLQKELSLAYPNPSPGVMKIQYFLTESENILLDIYDTHGQKVKTLVNAMKSAGSHEVVFDGHNLPAGVYSYRLQAGRFFECKQLFITK